MQEIVYNLWLGNEHDARMYRTLFDDVIDVRQRMYDCNQEDIKDGSVLDNYADYIHILLLEGRCILVHCTEGIERSPLVIVWFLVKYHYYYNLEIAYRRIIAKRGCVQKRDHWVDWKIREDEGFMKPSDKIKESLAERNNKMCPHLTGLMCDIRDNKCNDSKCDLVKK